MAVTSVGVYTIQCSTLSEYNAALAQITAWVPGPGVAPITNITANQSQKKITVTYASQPVAL